MGFPRPVSALAVIFVLMCCFAGAAQQSHLVGSSTNPPAHYSRSQANEIRAGTTSAGVYRNPYFGFTYKIPYGWVERTNEMQEGTSDSAGDAANNVLLLAIFERPPAAPGDTVNAAVVIAAEKLPDGYKGNAADSFAAITEVATAHGFKSDGDPYLVVKGQRKLVRGDFSKPIGQLTMHQSSLLILAKGYSVTWTFLAGSENDAEELVALLTVGKYKEFTTAGAAPGK